ncbi:MAG: hypothetical protein H0Z28_00610 [Archaeoglobus sp.]|nr:hypothetical protein [Archaeoglobus sp.]
MTAIKWIIVVFIAGFIGYFGKYLGKILIAKFHERKKVRAKKKTEEEIELEKERLKLEKKKLKIEKKKRKMKEKD